MCSCHVDWRRLKTDDWIQKLKKWFIKQEFYNKHEHEHEHEQQPTTEGEQGRT